MYVDAFGNSIIFKQNWNAYDKRIQRKKKKIQTHKKSHAIDSHAKVSNIIKISAVFAIFRLE